MPYDSCTCDLNAFKAPNICVWILLNASPMVFRLICSPAPCVSCKSVVEFGGLSRFGLIFFGKTTSYFRGGGVFSPNRF